MKVVFKKVMKRLRKTFVKLVPYNYLYKPKGYYRTIEEFINSDKGKHAKSIQIYPEYVSNTQIPQKFLELCTKYKELPAIATIPPAKLVVVPKGRLYTDSVENVSIITPDNKILGEVTYQNNPSNLIEENILLEQKYFIPVQHYKGVVFHLLIGGSGGTNYFHWLFDSLPRIHLLKKSGWFHKVDKFLVPAFKVDYQIDSLRMLGISEDKIIIGDKETHIQADILLASTYVRYHEHIPLWSCNFLREHFLKPETVSKPISHPYIYISRKDANRRRIANESELIKLLEEYGFKSFELTGLSFQEKISLFHHAKVVVATHGAGQANLVFCNRGTQVLEMIPDGFAFPIFYDIANKVGLNFNYLLFKLNTKINSSSKTNSIAKTMNQRIRADLVANLDEVKQKLDLIMNLQPTSL